MSISIPRLPDHERLVRSLTIERQRAWIRPLIALAVSTFLFVYVGPLVGSVWLGTILTLEGLCILTRARVLAGDERFGLASLAITFAISLCWVVHAVLLWGVGQEVPQIAALMDLFSVALYASIGAFHHRAVCLALVVPPLLALAGLLISYLWGHASPFVATMASLATLGTCATILMNCFVLHGWDKRLCESNVALEKLNADLAAVADAAQAANQAKSDFLSTMSHEIRTPLNGVLGMAQAMAAGELSPVQEQRLKVVRESGEALLAILNDVLDLSKIEAGKLELESVEFDLGALLKSIHAAYGVLAGQKGLTLSLSLDAAADGVYLGDPTRVRQVVANLVSNAVKFTEAGAVDIAATRRGEELFLSVSDTGIGISQTQIDALFQRFAQADSTTTRRFGGTGLGLAICHQLALAMGGSIDVNSAPGLGSTFTFHLSLPRSGDALTAQPGVGRRASPAQGASLKVLAAEDNRTNRLVLETLLQQIGVVPTIVQNGAEALEAWRNEPWDLVLMDIQMPVMDGPSAARAIRAAETAQGRARTPIIALTANAMVHQIAEYRASGMDGHVSKPIDAEELFQAVLSAAQAARADAEEENDRTAMA